MYRAYASLILELGVEKPLEYGVPAHLEELQCGSLVEVRVRQRCVKAYVLDIHDEPQFLPVQPILRVISKESLFTPDLFALCRWAADYYCTSLREMFRLALPSGVRKGLDPKEKIWIALNHSPKEIASLHESLPPRNSAQKAILYHLLQAKARVPRSELLEKTKASHATLLSLIQKGWLKECAVQVDHCSSLLLDEDYFLSSPKVLNNEQKEALTKIEKSLEARTFATHLLYGVTGSGKTEVYLQAVEKALSLGRSTLFLIPEIALAPQTIQSFKRRFQEKIAVLHHRLSERERNDTWHSIRSGKIKILIGARSAIFSPLPQLGLIIIDEEHESAYKQQDLSPSYHARDVAVMRGKLSSSTVILGSATPSLESYYNAQKGKYILSYLSRRADAAALLPKVTLVDMRREFERAKGFTHFSGLLLKSIERRLKEGEQTILFLNRRGYHTTLTCLECAHICKCAHCDLPLTFHLGENALSCHLCGYQFSPPPLDCPACKKGKCLKFRGAGTEQLQKALHAIFPSTKILRVDADTTRQKGSHQKLLKEFGSGKAQILIGTQMIAKGLHFPEVTLVGILNGDASLHIPDFRASEVTFQLITQIAGRSGRGLLPGEVILQTSLLHHPLLQCAAEQNYEKFYSLEMETRKAFAYPPFLQLVKCVWSCTEETRLLHTAEEFKNCLVELLPASFHAHPLIPCGHAKIKDRYRYQFFIKGSHLTPIREAIQQAKKKIPLPKDLRLCVDVNPLSTFF